MYIFIDREDEALSLCNTIAEYKGYVGVDTETTGLDWILDKILLLQLNLNNQIYILDIRKLGYGILSKIVSFLSNEDKTLIFHNAKFDIKFLYYATGILITNIYDTMICEVLLHVGKDNDLYYSLQKLVEKYTDYFMEKETRSEFINFPDEKPFTESMLAYSALDVAVLLQIQEGQSKEIEATKQTRVAKLENAVIPVVAKMEMDGIRLDVDEWLKVEAKAVERRDALVIEFKEMIADVVLNSKLANGMELATKLKIPVKGKSRIKALTELTDLPSLRGWFLSTFNPKSTYQVGEALKIMGIKVKNTNEKTLADFKGTPIIDKLLSIREVNKQIDSYGRNVIELIHPVTGKIHTDYKTIGTQTGRFSSQNPNMQQVPTHGGYRECFIPDDGYVFVGIDYSQQEYRLAGAISKDRRIIDAYKSGSDMHTATAQVLYGKEVVTKDERNRGKTVNFAILYGSTEYGLKRNLNISLDDAIQIINSFWDGYKQLSDFMKLAGEKITSLGYSRTPYGRIRYNLHKPTFMSAQELEKWQARVLREGKNHIIQGGGADILKIAMVEIFHKNPYGDKLKLCLQIHDELVAQVHKSVKEEAALFIKQIMEDVEQRFLGELPAKADGWDEFKERWSK